jgi:hypothetical protein
MGTRRRISVAVASAAAVAGLVGASPASASAPAGTVTPLSSACTTLHVQKGYGHAYVCKSWYAIGGGKYEGYLKGTTYHAGAPSNRTVEVDADLDGNKFQMDETFSTHSWGPTHYGGYKTVRLRACLHHPGASGESFCSGWW